MTIYAWIILGYWLCVIAIAGINRKDITTKREMIFLRNIMVLSLFMPFIGKK